MATVPPMECQIVQLEPGLLIPRGLTLRELAAVMAMQGLIRFDLNEKETARLAVVQADALIAAINSEAPNAQ